MYTPVFTTESGYILAIGAIMADGSKWIRWFAPGFVTLADYPRVIEYKSIEEARNHAKSVLRRAKRRGIFSRSVRSKVVAIYAD